MRGALPVGYLEELSALETAAVIYLRLWSEGPQNREDIWSDFQSTLGPARADHFQQSFEQLCQLCCSQGRRPLMRHSLHCKCLGGDEACFANFIAVAAEGEREDALMLATLLVRSDMAPPLTALATQVGLAFKQMQLGAPFGLADVGPSSATLH